MKYVYILLMLLLVGCKLGPKNYERYETDMETVTTVEGTFFVTVDYLQETKKTYRPNDLARLTTFILQTSRSKYPGQTPQVQECMDVFTVIVADDEEHYHKFDDPDKSGAIVAKAGNWRFPKVPGTDFVFAIKQTPYEEPNFSLMLHELGHIYRYCKFGGADSNHNDERIWAKLSQDSVLANAEMMECHYRFNQGLSVPTLCNKHFD